MRFNRLKCKLPSPQAPQEEHVHTPGAPASRPRLRRLSPLLGLLVGLNLLPGGAKAQSYEATVTRVVPSDGRVLLISDPKATGNCLQLPGSLLVPGARLPARARLCTDAHTGLVLLAAPRARVEFGPNSDATLRMEVPQPGGVDWVIETAAGWVRATLEKIPGGERSLLKVDAGNLVAAPKSTDYLVIHDGKGTTMVWVLEGEVLVTCRETVAHVAASSASPSECAQGIQLGAGQGVSRLEEGPLVRLDQPPESAQPIVRERGGRPPPGAGGTSPGQGMPPPPLPSLEAPASSTPAAPMPSGDVPQTLPETVPLHIE